MRSINEVCIKDHGEDELRGWGNRELGNGWIEAVKAGDVWVVESENGIEGHGYIKISEEKGGKVGFIHGLYLTPEVLGMGFGKKLLDLMLQKAFDHKVGIDDRQNL